MKNINTVLNKLTKQLESDATLTSKGYIIHQGEYINRDPDVRPWAGVYKGKREYKPGSLGPSPLQWDQTINIIIVTQAAYLGDGNICDELLEERVTDILNAINGEPTLSGTVDILNEISVDYSYVNDDSASILFQEAQINVSYEVADDG